MKTQTLEKVAAILLPHATVETGRVRNEPQLLIHSHTAKGLETKVYPLDLHHINAHIDPYFTLLLSPMGTYRLKVGTLYLSPEDYANPAVRTKYKFEAYRMLRLHLQG